MAGVHISGAIYLFQRHLSIRNGAVSLAGYILFFVHQEALYLI